MRPGPALQARDTTSPRCSRASLIGNSLIPKLYEMYQRAKQVITHHCPQLRPGDLGVKVDANRSAMRVIQPAL